MAAALSLAVDAELERSPRRAAGSRTASWRRCWRRIAATRSPRQSARALVEFTIDDLEQLPDDAGIDRDLAP